MYLSEVKFMVVLVCLYGFLSVSLFVPKIPRKILMLSQLFNSINCISMFSYPQNHFSFQNIFRYPV